MMMILTALQLAWHNTEARLLRLGILIVIFTAAAAAAVNAARRHKGSRKGVDRPRQSPGTLP